MLLAALSQGGRGAPRFGEDTGKAFDLEGNKHHTQETLGNQTELNFKSIELHVTLGHTNTNVLCKVVR